MQREAALKLLRRLAAPSGPALARARWVLTVQVSNCSLRFPPGTFPLEAVVLFTFFFGSYTVADREDP